MKKLFRKFRYGEKGFTLIELLVVVAILGILAAVAVPNVGKFINSGQTEAAQTELANVQTAVTAWMVDNGFATIPAGNAILTADNADNVLVTAKLLLQDTKYEYSCADDGTITQGAEK